MNHKIIPITLEYYDQIIDLWKNNAGLCLSESDSKDSFNAYLNRNQGFSFLAVTPDEKKVVGTIQAGHDQRSGYIYHLAVHHEYRRCGIATQLVNASTKALNDAGLTYIHIFVKTDNKEAIEFWQKAGWDMRPDLTVFSKSKKS